MDNAWIYKKLNEKHIGNYSLDQCIQYLGSENVFLHDYDILCVGYKNNSKQFYHLKILASSPSSKALQGPHEIILYAADQTPLQFWVWSLTTLRKKFFEFSDRLSFERSSFLVLHEPQILLRLKCVRSLLKILRKHPQQVQKTLSYEKLQQITAIPNESVFALVKRKRVNTLSSRIKTQQQNLLEQSFTSYLREFENTSLTRHEIFLKFQTDVLHNLKRLEEPQIPPITPNENPPEEDVDEEDDQTCLEFELHVIDFCH